VVRRRWLAVILVAAVIVATGQARVRKGNVHKRAKATHHSVLEPAFVQERDGGDTNVYSFALGWADKDLGNGPLDWGVARYRKDSKRVYLAGCVQWGGDSPDGTSAPNPLMFSLPEGYRPASGHVFTTDGGGVHTRVDIQSDGQVLFQGEDQQANEKVVCLDSIEFFHVDGLKSVKEQFPDLSSGIAQFTGDDGQVRYSKDAGRVYINGLVSAATDDSYSSAKSPEGMVTVFTLQSGFRPAQGVSTGCDCMGIKQGRIDIGPDGTVAYQGPDPGTGDNYISFDGVNFEGH